MRQVLFHIPVLNIPIFGYGMMLFLAFVGCVWLGMYLGRRKGIAPELYPDLAVWLFVSGILGARLTFVVMNWSQFQSIWQIIAIWDGGLVLYGSIGGAFIGYIIADRVLQRKYPHDRWKLADTIAPCIALGICLGRVGCLLNGCCYGNVACAHCPGIAFPLSAAPRYAMVDRGLQSPASFTLDRADPVRIDFVESGSEAEAAGLRHGDRIVKVNSVAINGIYDLHRTFKAAWPRGVNELTLTLEDSEGHVRDVVYTPWSLRLHPTQIYESISMVLMLFFLLSYFPYARPDGILMVIFMVGYAAHRYLNEMLRTDTDPVAFGLTLSQNISIIVFVFAMILGMAVWRHARQTPAIPTA